MAVKRKIKNTKPKTAKQRANELEREYYRGAIKEGQPKWQDVWKEIYG